MRWILFIMLASVAVSFADDQLIQQAMKNNALMVTKTDVVRFTNYSSKTQLKLNGKVSVVRFTTLSSATQSKLNGKVDKTTTVNGQPLSGNVTVTSITGNAGSSSDSSKLGGQIPAYYQAASTAITTGNIASQTVTTATGNAGGLTGTPNIVVGALTATGTSISLTGASVGVELGSGATPNTPYIDFHSSGNNIDYDARILASGGTGTPGNGAITITGSSISLPPVSALLATGTTNTSTLKLTGSVTGGTTYLQLWNTTTPIGIFGSLGAITGGASGDIGTYVYGNQNYIIYTSGTARQTISGDGATTFSGTVAAAGGSTNHTVCWKAGGVLGYCSSVVASDGSCTCN